MTWNLHPYRLDLATPYRWAEGTQHHREGALLSWGDGWGEIAPPPHEAFDAASARRHVAHAIDAWPDPAARDRLGAQGVSPRVLCAVSTAWWDHLARGDGRPLADMLAAAHRLGPPATSVPVNGLITADEEGIPAQVADAVRQGISVLKIKCGPDRNDDLARVTAVRDAAPDAVLRLDANRSWDVAWAEQHMRELEPLGIDYVEQPLPVADTQGMQRLQAAGLFDVAVDEAAISADAVRAALEGGQAAVAILKPQRLGGPDATIEAMQAAIEAGGRAVVTNSLESAVGMHTALHLAALLHQPEACGLATGGFLARDVAPSPPIRDGRMAVPGPGLGVVPDLEVLA